MTNRPRRIPLPGSRRPARELEHLEQSALFERVRLYAPGDPRLNLLFAIPNGGARHAATAAKLKAEGVRAGVPDLFLPCPSGPYPGLFIELKIHPNRPTDTQRAWHSALRSQGYRVEICYSSDAAWTVITSYLRGDIDEIDSDTDQRAAG